MEDEKPKSKCLAHNLGLNLTFLGFVSYIAAAYYLREQIWLTNWYLRQMDFLTFIFNDDIQWIVKLLYLGKWYGIYVGVIGVILWIIGYSIDKK